MLFNVLLELITQDQNVNSVQNTVVPAQHHSTAKTASVDIIKLQELVKLNVLGELTLQATNVLLAANLVKLVQDHQRLVAVAKKVTSSSTINV